MAFFEKLSKFFRGASLEASFGTPGTAGGPADSGKIVALRDGKPSSGNGKSARDLFLEELRAIPTRQSSVEKGRQEVLDELKRLAPPAQDPS